MAHVIDTHGSALLDATSAGDTLSVADLAALERIEATLIPRESFSSDECARCAYLQRQDYDAGLTAADHDLGHLLTDRDVREITSGMMAVCA